MQNDLKKFRSYLIPLISVIIVVVLIPTVVMPQIEQINKSWQIISQEEKKLDSLESKADQLEEMKADQTDLENDLKVAEAALPIQKDVAKLVRGIQAVAIEKGLTVVKLSIQPGKTATSSATADTTAPAGQTTTPTPPANNQNAANLSSSKDSLLLQLELEGNNANFKTFLKTLEVAKRLLVVKEFKAATAAGKTTYSVFISAPFGNLPDLSPAQVEQALPNLTAEDKKLIAELKSAIFNNVTESEIPTGPTGVENPF